MSPLIHAEVGWLLSLPLPQRRHRLLIVAAAVIPDIDGLGLLVSEHLYEAWHHRLAHGVFAAVATTMMVAAVTRLPKAALLALLAFHAHIAMDLCGSGPGWPIWYLWPVNLMEWLPSWQWDLASWQNSAFGLLSTLVCLGCALRFGRTPLEIFSVNADAKVVATLKKRFGGAGPQP